LVWRRGGSLFFLIRGHKMKEEERKVLGELIYSLIQDSQTAIREMGKEIQEIKKEIRDLKEKIQRLEFNAGI